MNKNISKDFAHNYDAYSRDNHWTSPGVLFDLCSEYLSQGKLLLDIGIGHAKADKDQPLIFEQAIQQPHKGMVIIHPAIII